MTKSETARLLTLIAAFDRRTIGDTDVEAWHLVIGDLNAEDCAEAVRQHFTSSTAWLMPAEVRRIAVTTSRHRIGKQRRAELERRIQQENNTGELTSRATPALAISGMPSVAAMLRTEVATKKRRPAADAKPVDETRREQARREIDQVREKTTATTGEPNE